MLFICLYCMFCFKEKLKTSQQHSIIFRANPKTESPEDGFEKTLEADKMKTAEEKEEEERAEEEEQKVIESETVNVKENDEEGELKATSDAHLPFLDEEKELEVVEEKKELVKEEEVEKEKDKEIEVHTYMFHVSSIKVQCVYLFLQSVRWSGW